MTPELWAVFLALMFGMGGAVIDKLTSVQDAIRKAAPSQKAVAHDAGIDPSHFTRKLTGQAHMTLRDIDAMPVPVQRWFHFEEVMRLGLPEEIKSALKVADVMRRMKRSA